jgi:hypothetical protein
MDIIEKLSKITFEDKEKEEIIKEAILEIRKLRNEYSGGQFMKRFMTKN